MGILNVTPDSFSDGGAIADARSALARALELEAQGADLLDLGGESTRPGSSPVPIEEELDRVRGPLELMQGRLSIPLSIDTSKYEVARLALAQGASVINDVTALGDPRMAELAAQFDAGVVLMHMQGTPLTMQQNPTYTDVVAEVLDWLAARVEWASAHGIPRANLAIDPGIGFGKTREHNLSLLRNLDRFASLGVVVLVGLSRKAIVGGMTGREPRDRLAGSVTAALLADAIRVWQAIKGWETGP
jgi:dihydropteroate synthase